MTSHNEPYLRRASYEDLMLLFNWANNIDVRKNAFNTANIPLEDHKKWFSKLMNDKNQAQYILMLQERPIGQIRLLFSDQEQAIIDYSIDEHYRKQGYGTKILNLIKEAVKKDFPFIKRLIGQVKAGNTASKLCFDRCGFSEKFTEYEFLIC